jgi:hypothetical protein
MSLQFVCTIFVKLVFRRSVVRHNGFANTAFQSIEWK